MDGGLDSGGEGNRLTNVFIDRWCSAIPETAVREMSARRVDALGQGTTLAGGLLLLGPSINGASSLLALQELRPRSPSLLVYVCWPSGSPLLRQIREYARAGADRLFTIGAASDITDLIQQVLERIAAPPPEIDLRTVAELNLPADMLRWVSHVFRNAYRPMRLGEVGRASGQAVRRIDEDLQNHGLPCLRDLWRCGQQSHLVELERRGVADANERAQRTQLGTATDVTKFRYRLRVTIKRSPRLASFAARIPSLVLSLRG